MLLKPRVTPIFDTSRGYVATHGSPWDYDRRVPILFWRKGMTPFEQSLAVETADILPTLAAMIGVTIPAGNDRRAVPGPGRGAGDQLPRSSCARLQGARSAASEAADAASLQLFACGCSRPGSYSQRSTFSASSSQRCSASSRSARALSIAAVSAAKRAGSRA